MNMIVRATLNYGKIKNFYSGVAKGYVFLLSLGLSEIYWIEVRVTKFFFFFQDFLREIPHPLFIEPAWGRNLIFLARQNGFSTRVTLVFVITIRLEAVGL